MRAAPLCLLLVSCVDTSPDRIKLTGEIASADLAVQRELLATALSGSFTLDLERGDLSESSATVAEAPVVSLLEAATGGQVVSLDATPEPALPWVVKPDQSIAVVFTLTSENLLDEDETTRVCASPVSLAALVEPSDADSFTVQSGSITVTGCP